MVEVSLAPHSPQFGLQKSISVQGQNHIRSTLLCWSFTEVKDLPKIENVLTNASDMRVLRTNLRTNVVEYT